MLEKNPGAMQVQKTLEALFPNARIFRADRDSIENPQDMARFISAAESGAAQILIGTQMISKGMDFPSLHLVGLIMADQGLNFPDFRSHENGFQLIAQMAGRAGRKEPGEVCIQTYNPHHPSLQFAKNHDYKGFAEMELQHRKKLFYPPFSRLCLLRIDSRKEDQARLFSQKAAALARRLALSSIKILGPAPAPLSKLKGRHRFQILVKAPEHLSLERFLSDLESKTKKSPLIRIKNR